MELLNLRDPHLHVDSDAVIPRHLTGMLTKVRISATDPLSVVCRCTYDGTTEVALKVFVFPPGFDSSDKNEFMRKVVHRFQAWKRLNHPSIVPFLGTVNGEFIGFEYPCFVSLWMKNRTLFDYIRQNATRLSFPDRIRLIAGIATGVKYLHSQGIVHGNIHPGNVLIGDDHQPRLSGFESSKILDQKLNQSHGDSIYDSGAVLWTAPEQLYPKLYPKLEFKVTVHTDVYSLSSIFFFVVSGEFPWKDRGLAENKLKNLQNPPRPASPASIPDDVWSFIERSWSPQDPRGRPSVQDLLAFCANRLEQYNIQSR